MVFTQEYNILYFTAEYFRNYNKENGDRVYPCLLKYWQNLFIATVIWFRLRKFGIPHLFFDHIVLTTLIREQ
jgi:hypothetical protein